MAIVTVQFKIKNGSVWPGSNHRPYQAKLDELTRKLPGYSNWLNDRVIPQTLLTAGDEIYEVTLQNHWFVSDTFLKLKYVEVVMDDGNGVTCPIELLTDIQATPKFHVYGSNGNPAFYNPHSSTSSPCNHEYIDTGFNIKKLVCKHCNKDKD